MEQPLAPNAARPTPSSPQEIRTKTNTPNNATKKKSRPPTPEEVVSHYQSLGLSEKEASLKAISDLQSVLLRTAASGSRANKNDRFISDAARKLDTLNTRLAILEMKLDSKPGFPESLAIGLTSGALLHCATSALPHLARIWDSIKTATTNTS